MTPRRAERYDTSVPKLDVALGDSVSGAIGQSGPDVWYRYDSSVVEIDDGQPTSPRAISVRMPVSASTYGHAETLAFFDNLLLESDTRSELARADHLDSADVSGLLGQVGAECAGAVSIRPHGAPAASIDAYQAYSQAEIESLFDERHGDRLAQAILDSQQVMSGVQRKLVLRLHDDTWYLPLNGSPSTHIIKRSSGRYDGLVANELACLRLFAACGLPVPEASALGPALEWPDGSVEPRLIAIRRYDRVAVGADASSDTAALPNIKRLHQEDLCQITGRRPTSKYQASGGPTFRDLANSIRRYSAQPEIDLENALKAAIANICVGNGDAHGKNFSLLVHADGQHRLAPFYDIVSTDVYPSLTPTFSMRFGYAERASELSSRDIERVAKDFGVGKALVRQIIEAITEALGTAIDGVIEDIEREVGFSSPVSARISGLVASRSEQLRSAAI